MEIRITQERERYMVLEKDMEKGLINYAAQGQELDELLAQKEKQLQYFKL